MPRPKTILDADILAVARRHFLEKGASASTRAIASDTGISEAVLFQRFGTKEGLFFAAMVPPAAELDDIFSVVPGKKSVAINLETIGIGILRYFREVMPIFLPLVAHPAFDLQTFVRQHEVPATTITQRLHDYLIGESKKGRVDEKQAVGVVQLLVSFVHNLAIAEFVGASDPKNASSAIRQVISAMWHGLRVR